jgi:hypothetical protein
MTRMVQLESSRHDNIVRFVGFLCVVTAPLWVYGLFFPFPPDSGLQSHFPTVLMVLLLVLAIQLTLIQRLSAGDRFMAGVMVVGFLLKLAAVSGFMFVMFRVYDSIADAGHYFESGVEIVDKYSLTGEWTTPRPLWSNNFIAMLASWLILVFGPSFQALMIMFATLSFWGQYLFLRAFCVAFPKGQHKAAALLMFFLPSVVFWTSPIGKDAAIFFFIGFCCYSFAKLKQKTNLVALVSLLVSLGGVMLVRPHIAGMLAVSICAAYVLSKNGTGLLGVAAKGLGVPFLLLVTIYLVTQARTFVDLGEIGQAAGIMKRVGEFNQVGGSAFGASFTYRLVVAPFLLFRPFPWEVRSAQSAIASMEALALLIFVWRRREFVRSSLRTWRENAFALFSWVYALEFSLLFAGAITNFGLLTRQRVMLIPLAVMIVLSQPLPSVGCLRIRG